MKKNLLVIFTFVFSLCAIYATLLVKVPNLRPSPRAVWTDIHLFASYFDSVEELGVDVGMYKNKWALRDANPLIPMYLVPRDSLSSSETADRMIRRIAIGDAADEDYQQRFKQGIAVALYRTTHPGEEFEREFNRVFANPYIGSHIVDRGYVFEDCPVVGSVINRDGNHLIAYNEDLTVDFDEPMKVLIYEPFIVSSGPNAGKRLAPVVTLDPINVSCIKVR